VPHCALSISEKHGHHNVHAEEWIGEKVCFVTTYTGASIIIAKLNITAGPRETGHAVRPADDKGGDPTLKETFVKLIGAAPTNNLCFYHQYYI
jgi:hypothetical protein